MGVISGSVPRVGKRVQVQGKTGSNRCTCYLLAERMPIVCSKLGNVPRSANVNGPPPRDTQGMQQLLTSAIFFAFDFPSKENYNRTSISCAISKRAGKGTCSMDFKSAFRQAAAQRGSTGKLVREKEALKLNAAVPLSRSYTSSTEASLRAAPTKLLSFLHYRARSSSKPSRHRRRHHPHQRQHRYVGSGAAANPFPARRDLLPPAGPSRGSAGSRHLGVRASRLFRRAQACSESNSGASSGGSPPQLLRHGAAGSRCTIGG